MVVAPGPETTTWGLASVGRRWVKPTMKEGKRYRFQKIERNEDGTLKLIGLLEEGSLRDQVHFLNLSPDGESDH